MKALIITVTLIPYVSVLTPKKGNGSGVKYPSLKWGTLNSSVAAVAVCNYGGSIFVLPLEVNSVLAVFNFSTFLLCLAISELKKKQLHFACI